MSKQSKFCAISTAIKQLKTIIISDAPIVWHSISIHDYNNRNFVKRLKQCTK